MEEYYRKYSKSHIKMLKRYAQQMYNALRFHNKKKKYGENRNGSNETSKDTSREGFNSN